MRQSSCRISSIQRAADNIFVITFVSDYLANAIRAGQFVNIKVDESCEPLLRRPYSVYRTEGDRVQILFNVVGKGSIALARRREGEAIDVLGPLGVPFTLGNYDTALLVAGGMGVAPMPLATGELKRLRKKVITLVGARTAGQLVDSYLENVQVATDDGTRGFHGTVVDLTKEILASRTIVRPRIFACGPTAMLRALASLAIERKVPCEVSLEGPMACGFGVCQGCPVELVGSDKKYALMCKDGPTFDVTKIKI
jgi:dihydroorotate dehydrogenase electron transfer subunit